MDLHPAANLALGLALVVGSFGLVTAATSAPRLWDPCHEWGLDDQGAQGVARDEDCAARSGSSETRGEALLNLAAIQGVLLLAAGSLARGALRLDRTWTGVGGALLAVLVPPFGLGIFWVPVLVAALFAYVAAARYPAAARRAPGAEQVVGYGVGVAGVGLVAAFLHVAGAGSIAWIAAAMGGLGLATAAFLARQAPPQAA